MNNGDLPARPMPLAANGQIFNGKDLVIDGQATGLTKREYFAAMAMQAKSCGNSLPASIIAEQSVEYADALLAELAK